MSDQLIDPSGIPHFIGDLATLDTDVTNVNTHAGQFRSAGADVHAEFQGLSAFYQAPEADQLFATTLPVKTKTDAFADDLEQVSSALSAYSTEVQPLVKKLDTLKADATAFVNSVSGDDDWRKDQDKVDHNNDLWHDVNHTVAAFQSAERAAYNKIMALIGGTALTTDDGSHAKNMYGFKAGDLDHAEETPWGSSAEREYEGLAWLGHQIKSYVWDGFIVDGVWGTIKGLGTLVGTDGWAAAGQAWKHLAQLGTALAITSTAMLGAAPVATAYWTAPDDKLPTWLRESRTTMKETGKALVAWDTWKTNPSRAAGAVTFNAVTAIFTGGAGSAASGAGKAGAVARALSITGKAARIVDPMTYVGKAGKFAFVKVGDTFTALKNLRTGASVDLIRQADAFRSPSIPETAIPYVDNATGKVVYLTEQGHLLNADGKLVQRADQAPGEVSAADRAVLDSTPHPRADGARQPDLVGAHAATNSATDGGQAGGHAAGSGGRDLGRGASGGDHPRADTSGAAHGAGDQSAAGRSASADSGAEHNLPDPVNTRPTGPEGHNTDRISNDGSETHPHQDLTPAERKAIQDEHVRKANEDPDWFKEHYDIRGHRLEPKDRIVDGTELPILAKKPGGGWVAKYDIPSGPSETRFGKTPLGRDTAPPDHLDILDGRARDRFLGMELTDAEKAHAANPTPNTADSLQAAQVNYHEHVGDVPNNSKLGEKLGEDASRYHVIPRTFPGAEWVELPKTANGADLFDDLYELPDDGFLVVEQKAPAGTLGWRQGVGDIAQGMRVKQGTSEYAHTIITLMWKRGGRDRELADLLFDALEDGKLQYVLVQARNNSGSYAGAILEYLKI
ncbi:MULTISPECIES: hypothetical protein [unclassified Streptomyces]|uniref:hypothetical protein n=1 Tax=unclassified Streptomyces TaxID=2593676 RepID=UPI002E178C09|nr:MULTISPECIES: hypothetical protein [unclassified Streptomyces]